jgi:hypothetical protein
VFSPLLNRTGQAPIVPIAPSTERE